MTASTWGGAAMERGTRGELIDRLAEAVGAVGAVTAGAVTAGAVTAGHPVRVAVDGPPAAGKTTLADELAVVLRAQGREVIRATVDDFLVPRAQRYRRGRYTAEGCYFDAHDRAALCRFLLDPLGPGGDRRFRTTAYDAETDTALSPPAATAPADAVLLFDGVFLLRPELLDRWDLRVLVSVPFEQTVDRARSRDAALTAAARSRDAALTAAAEIERSWHDRYLPAQRLYAATAHPADHADIIIYNTPLLSPTWEVRPG
ncbi:cytidylate kinase family protein [Streptomyces sp. NPDC008139]|uniref:cytidylate kinase family protein n=1 Tax=Streptomyces sp. NPDC008139 TaxID=3364814 RepID=UPI0036EF4E61